jgi:CheY-like chemotaxis protein
MAFNLLYIEDNMLNVRLVKRCLSKMDVDIAVAQDGDEGIRFVHNHCPDLILLDINLPTISGIDVTLQLKTKQNTKHIPIIALTADNTLLTRKLCEMYGVDAYLTKPISRHLLIETVQTFLPAIQPDLVAIRN